MGPAGKEKPGLLSCQTGSDGLDNIWVLFHTSSCSEPACSSPLAVYLGLAAWQLGVPSTNAACYHGVCSTYQADACSAAILGSLLRGRASLEASCMVLRSLRYPPDLACRAGLVT